ncbi:glycosyltransferase [Moritella yayanosii]|uniref:Uncharacterized protein n=1 Tax=Moritella yayanosii TaxID=69539 RepID=A0A330LS29_9GAMM|nr:glycosyltransferase [Moritella yayanosii]SQD79774.1 conserved protein of unknown function, might belong to Glycosyltransferase, group 1 family protein [Moritella yayanosii]
MNKVIIISNASSTHTVRWVNAIALKKFDVYLITQHDVMKGVSKNVNVIKLPFSGFKGYFFNVFALRKIIGELKPDNIHVHFASGYGTLALNARIKYLLSVWGSDVFRFPQQNKLNKFLLERVLNNATQIFSTSFAMKDETLKYTSKDIQVIPFGVSPDLYSNPNYSERSGTVTFGLAKVLEARYGVDTLLQSFAKLKKETDIQLKLEIAGDGPERRNLEILSKKLNIESSVKFLGWIHNADLHKFYKNIDVMVVPSREESFGVVAVEAGAAHLPCIVTDVGGLPEVILHDKTGIVVPVDDVYLMSRAMHKLAKDKPLRIQLGQKAYNNVIVKYDWNKNVDEMCNWYERGK